MNDIKKILVLILLSIYILFAQQNIPVPNDPAGDKALVRKGIMAANRVLLQISNTSLLGELSYMNRTQIAFWPNDYSGTASHDGIWFVVGAAVYIDTTKSPGDMDYILETHEAIAGCATIDTLYFIESYTWDLHDAPVDGSLQWGFYPAKGYFNEAQAAADEIPAMADKYTTFRYRDSWPVAGWPAISNGRDTLIYVDDEGNVGWNGRFGYNVFKSDLESYFVVNDAQDLENIKEDRFIGRRYYPRGENFKIGSVDPNVTIQNGEIWGGIGVRAAIRGYQWIHPQAQDAIFFEYNVSNFSDYNLPSMFLGYEVDNAVGGESTDGISGQTGADDVAYYVVEHEVNMAFVWDYDFIPVGGGKEPGVVGFAFLESPGLSTNGIDDDKDGVVDEQRTNTTTEYDKKVHYTEIIDDLAAFKEYYDYTHLTEKEFIHAINGEYHYPQDEDLDWRGYEDDNSNGRWDKGEAIHDDVGTDGLSPYDPVFYKGPDANGTEANGRPDCIEGLGSEPNFGTTDVNESDQLGLQNFKYLCNLMPVYTDWFHYGVLSDENCYKMHYDGITATDKGKKYDNAQSTQINFHMVFSSGMFSMEPGMTERMSLAELHAYDPLAGLRGDNPQAPALFRLTEIVNKIYETDYRFAQPPYMPELTAIPGDGKVVLIWNNDSERFTYEAFDKNRNDFQGYRIYRATDRQMSDPNLITDLNGNFIFKKPIFQCDIIDGKTGGVDFGLINGTGYNLGDDSGLNHTFVDTTVNNGLTYYYAIVAYDDGLPNIANGISPSENVIIIEKNAAEEVISTSRNVAIVTPFKKAAGYVSPGIENYTDETFGSGYVVPEIINQRRIVNNGDYKIKFQTTVDTLANVEHSICYWTRGLEVYRDDSLVYMETYTPIDLYRSKNIVLYKESCSFRKGTELTTDRFDGLRLKVYLPVVEAVLDTLNSGWRTGSGNIDIVSPLSGECYLPYDYEIIFDDDISENKVNSGKVKDSQGEIIANDNLIFDADLPFFVQNKSVPDAKTVLVVYDRNSNGRYDFETDRVMVGAPSSDGNQWGTLAFEVDLSKRDNLPAHGDSYYITFHRGFTASDEITFCVKKGGGIDKKKMKEDMKNIKVVPNPYICTNRLEPSVMNIYFNQRRRIMFTNVPAKCKIKIYTISGVLVDEIKVNNCVENTNEVYPDFDDNGNAFWDVLTREGLEVAAGYYLYHIKSDVTGNEKVGKFAIIK